MDNVATPAVQSSGLGQYSGYSDYYENSALSATPQMAATNSGAQVTIGLSTEINKMVAEGQANLQASYVELQKELRKSEDRARSLQDEVTRQARESNRNLRGLRDEFEKSQIDHDEFVRMIENEKSRDEIPEQLRPMFEKLKAGELTMDETRHFLATWAKETNSAQAAFLLLQLHVNKLSGAIELTTKIVEHGTSGIKTILQTQT